MKKVVAFFGTGMLMLGMAGEATAMFNISNVSLTSNSLTFTIDGNMTGYPAPTQDNTLLMVYGGEMYLSPPESTYTPNSWSSSVFDNKTVMLPGETGVWGGDGYTWSWYDSSLADAVSLNKTVTVTTGNYFDITKTGTIDFTWGHPQNQPAALIAQVNIVNGVESPAPEPSTYALMGIGGLLVMFRLKKSVGGSAFPV